MEVYSSSLLNSSLLGGASMQEQGVQTSFTGTGTS